MVTFHRYRYLLLAALFLFPSRLFAPPGIQLYVWEPQRSSIKLILPVRPGQSPEEAARAYVAAMNAEDPKNPGRKLFLRPPPEPQTLELGFARFYPLESPKESKNYEPRMALLSSEPEQMMPDSDFIQNVLRSFRRNSADPYVIPMAVDILLSPEERTQFREEVSRFFDAMVGLGGYDLDPSTYGQKNTASNHTNPIIDKLWVEMIRHYIDAERGPYFGICRGQQGAAVAEHGDLYQEIRSQTRNTGNHRFSSPPGQNQSEGANEPHKSVWHAIDIVPGSRLSRALPPGTTRIFVNSRHHQAVATPGMGQRVTATNDEGGEPVIEAMEFKNGMTVQFHPDDMMTSESEDILKYWVSWALKEHRRRQGGACNCRECLRALYEPRS